MINVFVRQLTYPAVRVPLPLIVDAGVWPSGHFPSSSQADALGVDNMSGNSGSGVGLAGNTGSAGAPAGGPVPANPDNANDFANALVVAVEDGAVAVGTLGAERARSRSRVR